MLVTLLLLVAAALADAREDLLVASNPELGRDTRQAAFDRLVALGATDYAYVLSISQDKSADTRQRWVAIRVLGRIGGAQNHQILLDLLADPEPAIRTAAVGALGDASAGGRGGYGDTIEVAAMLKDPAIMVRSAAAEALGQLRDPNAVPALTDALADSSNYHRGASLWVRKQYVDALGRIGSPQALPALLRALDDADPQVAAAAIAASEQIAGFSFKEGRTEAEEAEAWRRWMAAQIRAKGL